MAAAAPNEVTDSNSDALGKRSYYNSRRKTSRREETHSTAAMHSTWHGYGKIVEGDMLYPKKGQ